MPFRRGGDVPAEVVPPATPTTLPVYLRDLPFLVLKAVFAAAGVVVVGTVDVISETFVIKFMHFIVLWAAVRVFFAPLPIAG